MRETDYKTLPWEIEEMLVRASSPYAKSSATISVASLLIVMDRMAAWNTKGQGNMQHFVFFVGNGFEYKLLLSKDEFHANQ